MTDNGSQPPLTSKELNQTKLKGFDVHVSTAVDPNIQSEWPGQQPAMTQTTINSFLVQEKLPEGAGSASSSR